MDGYKLIDMASWPRREHYRYYTQTLSCGFSMTAPIDVFPVLDFARRSNLHFYGCFIHAIAKTVNQMDCFKMMKDASGFLGIWEAVHPNFTVFHKDTETFSDLWTEYNDDFRIFYNGFESTLDEYGDYPGMKPRPYQPANFFCVSCVPWIEYTSVTQMQEGTMPLFPVICFGKYKEDGASAKLPLSIQINHAAADGYHVAKFFEKLQENVNAFREF